MSVNWTEIVERSIAVRVPLELPRNIKLPCLPQSVIEFTSISNDPAAGPEDLAKAVQSDSALTAALLGRVDIHSTSFIKAASHTKPAKVGMSFSYRVATRRKIFRRAKNRST